MTTTISEPCLSMRKGQISPQKGIHGSSTISATSILCNIFSLNFCPSVLMTAQPQQLGSSMCVAGYLRQWELLKVKLDP